jgi:hypothetical protein
MSGRGQTGSILPNDPQIADCRMKSVLAAERHFVLAGLHHKKFFPE